MAWVRPLQLILMVWAFVSSTQALLISYCATSNTAANGKSVYNQFMSNGYCLKAGSGYSVGVLQGFNCWCSDLIPESQTSLSDCETSCPGYPTDYCAGQGYFAYLIIDGGYLTVDLSSSTTSSRSSSSSSSSATSSSVPSSSLSSSPSSSSSLSTQISSSSIRTSSSSSSSTTSSSSLSSTTSTSSSSTADTSSSSSDDSSSSYSTVASSSSLQVLATTIYRTVSGQATSQIILTAYVTETPTPTTSGAASVSETAAPTHKKGFFDSKGKVAGTFTAVGVVVLALLLSFLYCFFCVGCCGYGGRHGNHSDEEAEYLSDELLFPEKNRYAAAAGGIGALGAADGANGARLGTLTRDSSHNTLKSFFTLSPAAGQAVGRNLLKKKLLLRSGSSGAGSAPIYNSGISGGEAGHLASNSFGDGELMGPIAEFDHRLDPKLFLEVNESKNTLGDEVDYSRRLKVTNPEY